MNCNSMEGHVQIKQHITVKHLKLTEFVQLWGKIFIQYFFLEKSLEFFSLLSILYLQIFDKVYF